MDIIDFINAAEECWRDVPNTNLEASSYGRIRNIITKAFFGEVRFLEDLSGILSGNIPVWEMDSVVMTPAPRSYFRHRKRHDRQDEEALLHGLAA